MSKYAIVGLSCLFPGAATPEQFWDNLMAGRDSRQEGGERIFGPPTPAADGDPDHRITCTRGGFITDFAFDAGGYRLDARYLEGLDRLFHWTLHTGRAALRDSGYADRPDTLARTALILGNYSFPTPASARISLPLVQDAVLHGLRDAGLPGVGPGARGGAWRATPENGRVSGAPAGVAAAALGIGGPRYVLDAACSSALYALKLACDHLATGDVDLALAGGVCAPDPTLIHVSFSNLHAYPEDGFSQPFDAASSGILTGQGAGMVAVRRLDDALAAGDHVYAVIDGIGLSNDGGGRHLLIPNPAGQLRAYELAYAQAGLDPSAVDYLECHATGTPVGDRTEAETVAEFFGGSGKVPLLGSVKGNIGHLLTVAGLSSMIKVILAMGHGYLPPTPGVSDPVAPGTLDPETLVRSGRPWPDGPGPRRAAVSAFGFGGTNAHVILSLPRPPAPAGAAPAAGSAPAAADDPAADRAGAPVKAPALEITGIGAHFGTLESAEALERAVYEGRESFGPLPERRWRGMEEPPDGLLAAAGLDRAALPDGAFVDAVSVDPVDHRIPPADLRNYNLQHALVSKVADEALHDAGYRRTPDGEQRAPGRRRVAVVVAMEIEPSAHLHLARHGLAAFLRTAYATAGFEPTEEQHAELARIARDGVHRPIVANEVLSYIGNIMTSRISSLWNLTGPSFTVSAQGAGAVEALRVARLLLLDEDIEAVLVGAVDLAASPESLLLRADEETGAGPVAGAGLSFGAGQRGWRIGEGAGAVVVTRPGEGRRPGYARVESIALRHTSGGPAAAARPDAAALTAAARQALDDAGLSADDIGYVEACAAGSADLDGAELAALAAVHPAGTADVALGSAKAHLGHTGAAAEMAGLLRAVFATHHAYLPGTPSWQRPADDLAGLFADSALYVPDATRPWLRRDSRTRRHAAVTFVGRDGTHGHLVVSASAPVGRRPTEWRKAGGPVLLALGAADLDGLLSAVRQARGEIEQGVDPWHVARRALTRLPATGLRVVLVGADRDRLLGQLDLAARSLPGAHRSGGEWSTPAGSYFTARPLGPDGKVALVYPGAFNSYPGLGQDLFRAFPDLLRRFEEETPEPERAFRAEGLYPRSVTALSRRDLMRREEELADDLPSMLATGTTFAILHTDLVRQVLGVRAHGAFGYSLGESSMLFATGGWLRSARRDDRISATPLFRDRLVGRRSTVRELWGLPAGLPDDEVWACHVLLAPADEVRAAVARYDRLFLTHVNTPAEVVVAGSPEQCGALIAELGCRAARSPVNVVMHCSVVDAELDALAELNDHPVGTPDGLELLSAHTYGPTTAADDRRTVAHRIARTLRDTIDFPRLVESAYARGFRYFVEVGPSATCTRWVKETLGERAHVAVATDRRGMAATRTVADLAARLVAHGVPVDLAGLLGADTGADAATAATARVARTFPVGGGEPIAAGITERARAVLAPKAPSHPAPATPPATPAPPAPTAAPAPAPTPTPEPTTTAEPAPVPTRTAAPAPAPRPGPAAPVAVGASYPSAAGAQDAPDPHRTDSRTRPAARAAAPRAVAPVSASTAAAAASVEEHVPMSETLSFAPDDSLAFDGEPVAFLPWATHEGAAAGPPPAPHGAAHERAVATGPETASGSGSATGSGPGDGSGAVGLSAAARLVGEVRQQMVSTHLVVMETQRILQDHALDRVRAELDAAAALPPTAPDAAAPPASLAPPAATPPAALPAPASAPHAPAPDAAAPLATPPADTDAAPGSPRPGLPGDVLFDEQALLAFATGRIADVFGPDYAPVDGYGKRVRLPAPPYHFVTRVTALDGERGRFEPSFIRTEYDVPRDAWYAVDGGVPPAVAIEAGQCDLLLISYLGIDFHNKGERVYRLLDSTLVFHGDLPRAGQTLRYDISINRFVHQGDTTLFFFSYLCYADGELILELKNACAGFFSERELNAPLGVVVTEREKAERAKLTRTSFKPLAATDRDRLGPDDLEALAQGRPGDVFGPGHAQDAGLNPALRLPDARLRMVDEITVERTGGPRGIGALSAVKHLDPNAWYFACHFPDDPVLAGSLVAEGAVQVLQTYLLHQGMHLVLPDARFQTIIGLETAVQVRGQITPEHRSIRYELEVRELTLLPRPSVVADVLVYLGDKPVIRMRDFGVQIREKDGTPYRPGPGGIPAFLGRRGSDGAPAMINELHLAHAAKGNLGTAMGPEFDIYDTRRAPHIPNGDFQFVDRIMSMTGTRGDTAPGSEMVTEYDSPADAWYYTENSHPHLPNCVLMETSLQAAILLGYYLGATLKQPGTEYRIRNLDGRATYVKDVDLRGKTIRHHSKLLMTSAVSGAVLQNFSYELSADGEVFYRGESLFGYFSEAALATQAGLDNGSYRPPWIESEAPEPERVRRIELGAGAQAATGAAERGPRLPGGRFDLVDRVDLVADGGRYAKGYLHGHRAVRPDEWYFSCHFHRDPVMPGSLGVEAVLQALRAFVLAEGLADGIDEPRFALASGVETSWKYRGQILREDPELFFDVHVKDIRRDGGRLVVVADADLWKPGLRIYELTDVAVEVRPAD